MHFQFGLICSKSLAVPALHFSMFLVGFLQNDAIIHVEGQVNHVVQPCGFEEMIASIEMAQLTKGTVDALKTGVARGPGGCSVPNRILDCRFQRYLGHG